MDTLASLLHTTPATAWMVVKVLLAFGLVMGIAPPLTWAERRGSAMIQDRIGPNRAALFGKIRILGLVQALADGLKFFFKEDLVPPHVNKRLFWLAPALAFVPAMLGFAVIPMGRSFVSGGTTYHFSLLDPGNGMGMLFPMAVGAMAVYGIMVAAWSSNNKWAILGGMRASAQMVSYEIGLTMAVLAIFMTTGGYDPHEIVKAQQGVFTLAGIPIPNWNLFHQPLGFLVFFVCMFAEANRLPFDFAEGESEIVAGFHIEYGSMKFALIGLAEYGHILGASALITTMYLGGWGIPFVANHEAVPVVLTFLMFLSKVIFLSLVFIWVRWTLPRFRYDQLMDLGWKKLLPISMANLLFFAYRMKGLTMGVIVKKVELSWWERLYVLSVLAGMGVTFRHFIKQLFTPTSKRFTIQYPDMKKPMPKGYRGLHELKRFESGAIKCVACYMCQEACPARCISIEAEEFSELNFTQGFQEKRPAVFKIDMLRCIYCGMCEEACPKDAIWLRDNYELAAYDRLSMNFGKWDLMNTYAEADGKARLSKAEESPTTPSRRGTVAPGAL